MFHSFLMKDPDYKLTKEQVVKMDSLYEELNKKTTTICISFITRFIFQQKQKKKD